MQPAQIVSTTFAATSCFFSVSASRRARASESLRVCDISSQGEISLPMSARNGISTLDRQSPNLPAGMPSPKHTYQPDLSPWPLPPFVPDANRCSLPSNLMSVGGSSPADRMAFASCISGGSICGWLDGDQSPSISVRSAMCGSPNNR